MHITDMKSQISEAARRLLRDHLDELMSASTAHLLALEPHYKPIGEKTLADQMRKNISLTLLRVSGDPIPEEFAGAAYETGQIRAIQQVELPAVSRSFRIDLRVLWEAFLRDGERHGIASSTEYVAELLRIWEAVEANINDMTEGYRVTAEQLKQQDNELRLAAFRRLLSVGMSGNFSAISRQLSTLAFDPNAPLFVVVSDMREADYAELSVVQARLSQRGVTNYFGWHEESLIGMLQARGFEATALVIMLRELGAFRTAVAHVLQAVGLSDAVRNARVLMDSAPGPGLRVLSDAWIEAIAHAEPVLIDALVAETFSDFGDLSDYVQGELLRTIEGFLTTHGTIAEIAAKTYRHRNTVRNRLTQIESLTGLDLSSPSDVALLALAYPALRRGLPRS